MAASPGTAGVGGAGAMPGSGPSSFGFDSGLEIKTRSVEQTLLPLVSQVKWLPARPLVSCGRGPRWRPEAALPHIPRPHHGVRVRPPVRAGDPPRRQRRREPGLPPTPPPPTSGGEAAGAERGGGGGRRSRCGPSAGRQVRPGRTRRTRLGAAARASRAPRAPRGGRAAEPSSRRQRGPWPGPPLAQRDPPRRPLLTRCRLTFAFPAQTGCWPLRRGLLRLLLQRSPGLCPFPAAGGVRLAGSPAPGRPPCPSPACSRRWLLSRLGRVK